MDNLKCTMLFALLALSIISISGSRFSCEIDVRIKLYDCMASVDSEVTSDSCQMERRRWNCSLVKRHERNFCQIYVSSSANPSKKVARIKKVGGRFCPHSSIF
ncbi:Uncharacterised protein at_DN0181 [Pycnogonum litorale]